MSQSLVWTVRRRPSVGGATIGELDLGSGRFCYTLEDEIREVAGVPVAQWKVPGATAIPAGRYKLAVTQSARYGRPLPVLIGVEGFTGIRIHPGNGPHDTEGCILVGQAIGGPASLLRSRLAFDELFKRLRYAVLVMDVYLDIQNPPARLPGELAA
jgi:hypothetical protein